ncbi:MAG: hypothetical protein KDE56_10700, partial [Anaerolineales bacterium]|nr:hypothetical protein [Anaerolineales bacterium]
MKNDYLLGPANSFGMRVASMSMQRKTMVGVILMIALFAFEIFNFDTTQFALRSLLGDVRFLGVGWASILAIAFCSIDFAGLIRIFTPQKGASEPREVWYLMGAWILGAAMNAVMTWWAVSLTLLNHSFGNEVLSREQLLTYVPIFVAVLVWLTRILFIGAFTVAGEHIFDFGYSNQNSSPKRQSVPTGPMNTVAQRRAAPRQAAAPQRTAVHTRPAPVEPTYEPLPASAQATQVMSQPAPKPQPLPSAPGNPTPLRQPTSQPGTSRVRQRPP